MLFHKTGVVIVAASIAISSLVSLSGYAANSQTYYKVETTDTWKLTVAPYLWAVHMSGRVQAGPLTTHISENFSQLMSQYDGGGMLWLDARRGKADLFLNSMYVVLEKTTTFRALNIFSKNNFGIFSAGGAYEVYRHNFTNSSTLTIEPYLGVRYTLNNTTLQIKRFGLKTTDNQHWTAPFIGARFNYQFNPKWMVILAGDIGGTNASTDKSYNVQGFLGYKPSLRTALYAGYRLLYQDYKTGSGLNRFDWDMKLFGPVLGGSIEFG